MTKTTKYNDMLESFECDFNLIMEGEQTFASLDELRESQNERLLTDMDLLRELAFLLRHDKAEIRIKERD